ncbi:MAG: hypothetical protein BM557_05065 [Flavobacterium sp. MedPE-SWcel]|uniref:hypothetical protein n=1 Tax=uncultured Flavobacterium sp. TaxID=165435 RepID=UPI0009209568|nr:hypothetical protein [uncultured Flavobacterium sp.]OIQ21125.1 MAG: hypothetical protein BM557_05065 [Flavobacterium sp. MedPE-SWcel]
MKKLINQTLLYDEDCPLCHAYTGAFVKSGMLDENGKKPYCQLSDKELQIIDTKRAANEIALIDSKTNTVIYGVDSLLKIIGNSFPIVNTIGNVLPIKFALKKLYSFISYNRKVIIPSKKSNDALQCTPTFNYHYRILYLIFTIMVTAMVLYNFSDLLPIPPNNSGFGREVTLALGQLIFQYIFLHKLNNKTILNYLGNVMTVSLIGSLLLLPVLLINSFIDLPSIINIVYFVAIVTFMFIEHSRRVKTLELPHHLSYTWVLYRLIALLIILNL